MATQHSRQWTKGRQSFDKRQSILADLRWYRGMHEGGGNEKNARKMHIENQWKFFGQWRKSLNNTTPLDDERPWMTFSAIAAQEKMFPVGTVFEWGSGGSTIFYRNRAKRVITIEHDLEYFELVSKRLRASDDHEYHLIPPTDRIDEKYQSTMCSDLGSFEDYVRFIDRFRDETFDVVCVDGRARVPCVEAAASKVKPGGFLVLDNSERLIYQSVNEILGSEWNAIRFAGCGPYNRYFWETTIFGRALR